MSLSGIDLNTIIHFAAIIVVVIVVFSILSFIFKHLIHWFRAAADALCFSCWLILSSMFC